MTHFSQQLGDVAPRGGSVNAQRSVSPTRATRCVTAAVVAGPGPSVLTAGRGRETSPPGPRVERVRSGSVFRKSLPSTEGVQTDSPGLAVVLRAHALLGGCCPDSRVSEGSRRSEWPGSFCF